MLLRDRDEDRDMGTEELERKYNLLVEQNRKYEKVQRLIAENLDKYEKAARENQMIIERLHRENEVQKSQITALQEERAELYAKIDKYKEIEKEYAKVKGELNSIQTTAQRQGVVGFRKELIDNLAAKILVKSIQGYDVADVVNYIKIDCKKTIPPAKVYRTISVKEDNDLARMLAIYQENREEFGGLTEEDVRNWFIRKRVKKLRLMDETELRFEYGAEIVNTVMQEIKPDKIVQGYYAADKFDEYKKLHSKPENAISYFNALEMLEM